MTKRRLEILGAVITIVVLLILLLWLFIWQPKPAEEPDVEIQPDFSDQVDVVVPDEPAGPPLITPQPAARSFVERFGSFSTESDYKNVEDVMNLATNDLQGRLWNIAEQARRDVVGSFYGVSTRVISMNTVSQTDTAASLVITTQREETFETPANTSVKYQDITLDLVRVGDSWLVNDFLWQ